MCAAVSAQIASTLAAINICELPIKTYEFRHSRRFSIVTSMRERTRPPAKGAGHVGKRHHAHRGEDRDGRYDHPLLKAASIMSAYQIRRIPVAVGNRLVGIVSIGDVHKAIFKNNLDLPAA